MPDLEFISQLKGEPIALVVFGAMIFYKIIEELTKHIVPLISKKKKKSVEEILAEDAQERKARQAELDAKLAEIEASIQELMQTVADNEELLDSVSQGTLENMLFNDKQSPFRRLKAFLRLLAMGKNGRVWQKGFEVVLNNKETWLDVLDTKPKLRITDQKYLDARLEEIDRRIFKG